MEVHLALLYLYGCIFLTFDLLVLQELVISYITVLNGSAIAKMEVRKQLRVMPSGLQNP